MPEDSIIDLRSDTVTRPGTAMYEAMRQAAVGDDVYGEDPTVNRLEAMAAARLGKQAGLFLSSATQANLVAMLVHTARGDEVLLGDKYHIFVSEAGGTSALGGVVLYPIATDADGGITPAQVLAAIKDDDPHHPITRTLALENTVHGQVQDPAKHRALAEIAREHRLRLHLDGARLMNAAVALGVDAAELAAPFDTVMLCLSKGLGAPVGACLCGSEEFIARARRQRKMLGGGMRQAGVLAACGIYALENNVERLAEDHARAAQLAEGLVAIDGLPVRLATNMVFVEPRAEDIAPLTAHLRQSGVEIGEQAPRLRLVTHLDIDDAGIERAIDGFRSYYG
jgi:threonine aldolase